MLVVWLSNTQLSYAWTLDGGLIFEDNKAHGTVAAFSPVSEAATINKLTVDVAIYEGGTFRDDDGDLCVRSTGTLSCVGLATDTSLVASVVYRADGVGVATPNGNPASRQFSITDTWLAPPTASLILEHLQNCNWLVTSNDVEPDYTFQIEHRPTNGGSWSLTYSGADACVGRLAPKNYRAVYRDAGDNRGSYSSIKTTSCIFNPPQ